MRVGSAALRRSLKKMDPTLAASADSFLQRCSEADVTGVCSPEADLVAFDNRYPGLLPSWYRELLATKALGDICFETEVDGLDWGGEGHIRDAATLLVEVEGALPDSQLAEHGYLAIGAAGDGDCWVIRSGSSSSDPVFLLSFSSYGPGAPEENPGCLLPHGTSFADFLGRLAPVNQ